MSGFISRRFLLILGVYVIVLGSALFWRRVVDYYSPDRFGGANANANATTTITTQAEGPIRGSEQGLTAASASTENVDQQANGQSELSSDKKTEESDASTQTAAIEPPKDPTAVTPQSATPPSVNIASPSTSPSGTPSAPPAEKTQTAAVADEASPSSASSWLTSLLGNVSGTSGANENKPSPADPSLSGAPNQTALSDQGVADQTSNGNTTNQTVLSETTNQTAPSSGGTLLSQSTDNVTAAEIAEADKYFGFTPSVRPRSNRTVTVQFMTSSHLKYPDGPFPGCSVPCAVYSAKSPKRNDKNAEVLMWHGVVGSKWSNVKNWGLEKPILPWQAKAFTGMESAVRTPVLQDYEKLFNLCLHNADFVRETDPKKKGPVNKRATFQRYKFCLVFENSITKDYVTEKLFEALDAG
uniref:Fucosyltransferase n=1 Tax=Chromera velia CCMP2878 TaxID=1169474 RepID=A0A0G4FHH7_9ALVE|eukprot:Cvel_3336.t1-p1 / transcript=Cvel_3336.t1 / gene=Cvel_3336 / organism=Chromera_velia_CCMP2878 / gene_product=hypothetical protein / transcript_product=hypothetical protein / location=Cvel_scaffold133:132-5758(-) / protein_length=412 / sequence_SO=supercontig / SO=protein_coding / is_pseudo=false